MNEKQLTIAQPKQSALAVMANNLSVEPAKLLDTLKATVFKGASNEELLALVVVANSYRLNPLLKEMYAFPAKGGGIVPVVSIDGWISMVNRQPDLDGIDFAFSPDGSECTCTIHVKGRAHPVRVTEYLAECQRKTEPWQTMPRRMLRHKALIQAARIAFGFSGIYDEDEGKRIAEARVIVAESKPSFLPALPEKDRRQETIDSILRDIESAGIELSDFMRNLRDRHGIKAVTLQEIDDSTLIDIACSPDVIIAEIKEGK